MIVRSVGGARFRLGWSGHGDATRYVVRELLGVEQVGIDGFDSCPGASEETRNRGSAKSFRGDVRPGDTPVMCG